ncbi:MAG TPA: threonine--tRNA ligase [Polyangiaceae bacterium]|jgi:threonyl-tRNA synthetase|nr:threonine--tRNA ligase [Polyangiaceae bacterium]
MTAAVRRTPREILAERNELDRDVVAVRAGDEIIDLMTPIDPAQPLKVIRRNDPDALEVIRHSTSHVMAQAVQKLFPGTQVTIGPAIENGFYYDFDKPDGPFTDQDLGKIEKEMRRVISQDLPFHRKPVSRQEAKNLFEGMGERYKLELIDSIPEGEEISVYWHGKDDKPETQWLDLCSGPHVPTTKLLGVVKLTSVAGAYWRGDEKNKMLQRIYGTAFATQEELDAYLKMLAEARARDHRKLGKELELFTFHEWAPAMPIFLPRGAFVYNQLVQYVRGLYTDYGYEEVITPQIFDRRLFEMSGHLPSYRENMYFPSTPDAVDEARAGGENSLSELETLSLKPMNCPGHCLIFGQRRRSYRELPWRVADFGRLHRFERGGVVHGLTRVRSFSQDDAHIFCTQDQVRGEIASFNKLLFEVYKVFGFTDLSLKLTLRPEKRVGTDAQWDLAEKTLDEALRDTGLPFETIPGEGAIYGPKIEFHVKDAIGRGWQLGTIQLDYVLPDRFGLEFVGSDGAGHRPAMLHRAILGSLERFIGMYIEHVAGKFPVWLAPEQVVVATVSDRQNEYAARIGRELREVGLRVTIDDSADKLGAKIRNARMMRVPYIAVIGDDETAAETVAPKTNDGTDLGAMPLAEFKARLLAESRAPRIQIPGS